MTEKPQSHPPQAGEKNAVAAVPGDAGFVSRAIGWTRAHLVIVAGTILAITGLAAVAGFMLFRSPVERHATGAAEVLAAFEAGEIARAEALANEINARFLAPPKDRSAASLVLGLSAAERAERMLGAVRARIYHQAAEHLLRAVDIGIPAEFEAEALFALGKSLLFSGQVEASRTTLRQILKINPEAPAEVDRLLADAYYRDPKPEPATALDFIDRYLADQQADGKDRKQAELLRADILIELNKFAEARDALTPLVNDPDVGTEAQVAAARADLQESRQFRQAGELAHRKEDLAKADELTEHAIEKLRKVEAHAPRDHNAIGSAMYLIGVCFLEQDDSRAALDEFERAYKRYLDSPDGWASLVEIAGIKLALRQDEEAVQAYLESLRVNRHLAPSGSRWISQQGFRDRLVKGYEVLVEHAAYQDAIALAQSMAPPIPEEDAKELQAKAFQSWGRRLLADAARMAPAEAKNQQRQARAKLRSAGRLFDELARKRFATRFYPIDRWNAAECYLEAQNFPVAVSYLKELLARAPRRDRPTALLALGRALLALGKYNESIAALHECIEFYAKHPAQFEARVLCSHAYLEQDEIESAERCLLDNLEGDLLTPSSKEWRESLFALARLLHQTGRYADGIPRLQEAIERYPDDHQALDARYLLADCHLQLASRYSKQLEAELVEDTRRWLGESRRRSYEQAVTWFEQLFERLRDREASAELSAAERALERTSMFNHAAVLVALERFPQAIEAYTSALSRYQNVPESLAAYVQIALCHRRLGHPDEAQTALSLAKVSLDRMPADAPFLTASGFSRDVWSSHLEWLTTL